jgi:mRNA interferase RelE/StbE
MTWQVRFDKHAVRALAGLEADARRRLQAGAISLTEDPLRRRPGADIKRLQGQPGVFRLRIGEYRLFYVVYTTAHVVVVTDVRHRSHAYD